MTNSPKLAYVFGAAIGLVLVIALFVAIPAVNRDALHGVPAVLPYDTTSAGFTSTTSTVNTTSTQVFASIARYAEMINDTTAKLTCSLDPANTTAASSTVAAGRGVIIVPAASSTSDSKVRFGECRGESNCYPHKGAVNCLGTSAVTITKNVQ